MVRQGGRFCGRTTALLGGLGLVVLPHGLLRAQGTGGVPDAQVEANVLKALASAPELSTQNIQSSTVYGTVTLSGTVQSETLRTRAENLAARAPGVQKVVDELALGASAPASTADQAQADPAGQPPPGEGGAQAPPGYINGEQAYGQPAPPENPYGAQPGYSQPAAGQPGYSQPGYGQSSAPYGQAQAPYGQGQPPYTPQQAPYGASQAPYGQPAAPYGQPQGAYGQPGYPPQQPAYAAPQQPGYAPAPGSQAAGLAVTVPGGALLRIRINRGLDSNHITVGTPFDGTVLNDVAAEGAIAIPRGATVQGVVVDAKKAGALKGEGELSLQVNSVTLGGVTYPLVTDVWQQQGRDKTGHTVNSALGLGVLGAIVGGVAGGGAGAAIGAGVGAGAGVAGSAATPGGRIIIPPEAVLSFTVAQPAQVRTVSEQEMQRLAYAAGPGPSAQPLVRRRYPYPPPPGYPYSY